MNFQVKLSILKKKVRFPSSHIIESPRVQATNSLYCHSDDGWMQSLRSCHKPARPLNWPSWAVHIRSDPRTSCATIYRVGPFRGLITIPRDRQSDLFHWTRWVATSRLLLCVKPGFANRLHFCCNSDRFFFVLDIPISCFSFVCVVCHVLIARRLQAALLTYLRTPISMNSF